MVAVIASHRRFNSWQNETSVLSQEDVEEGLVLSLACAIMVFCYGLKLHNGEERRIFFCFVCFYIF